MITKFQLTKILFQNQFHERYSFSLNYQGNNFQGIYHKGVIDWFNPHPFNKIGSQQLGKLESIVATIMQKLLCPCKNA
ncbi:hypothetical protein FQ087_00800 [Sporosarcina sp. ANT_H38]|uniref:DUF5342 family protein n=1 Tax=Sporosarcina sp. ANT_H38 TaxID=2597358 RepID=UPI0011F29C3B|nr:DUF5342 family protein [Sporosarcina sp. ANT_H38]KAA0964902.1 hypothetical protein FQ087_00800 [Sporosarcina sp. ANT_H38]